MINNQLMTISEEEHKILCLLAKRAGSPYEHYWLVYRGDVSLECLICHETVFIRRDHGLKHIRERAILRVSYDDTINETRNKAIMLFG